MSPISMTRIKELLDKITECTSAGMVNTDAGQNLSEFEDIAYYVGQIREALESEERVEYVVQKKDEINEARGAAIAAINKYKRSLLTPEEAKALVEKDLADLFGEDES